MDDIGHVDHNEHQKVMDGFGAQIDRLDRRLHKLRDQLIAAGDAITVDRLSDETAAAKKQKAEIEKLQEVMFTSNSSSVPLANRCSGRVGKLQPCSNQGPHRKGATNSPSEAVPEWKDLSRFARGHRSHT